MATELTRLVEGGVRVSDIEDQSEKNTSSFIRPPNRKTCCGDWFRSLAFGGFDGVIAALVLIFGAAGCNLHNNGVLLLGFSYLGGTAIYVVLSEFVSAKAHRDFLLTEKRRATWEFKHFKEQEVKEMENSFVAKGMSRKDAESVVRKISAYENVFVGLIASEELGQRLPSYNEESTLILASDAVLVGISYGLLGCLCLATKLLTMRFFESDATALEVTFGVTILLLIIMNVIKSSFGTGKWLYAAFEGALFGVVCSLASYYVGFGLNRIAGSE